MALMDCPECAQQVSDKAKACPHCGFPLSEAPAPTLTLREQVERDSAALQEAYGRLSDEMIDGDPDELAKRCDELDELFRKGKSPEYLQELAAYDEREKTAMEEINAKQAELDKAEFLAFLATHGSQAAKTMLKALTEAADHGRQQMLEYERGRQAFEERLASTAFGRSLVETGGAPRSSIICPKCGARDAYHAGERGFSVGTAALVGQLAAPVGILAGMVGRKDIRLTCLKCGHRWEPHA